MGDLAAVLNLLLAFLLGGSIGWLREKEGKTAGLRTYILVCVGAALFMIISADMALKFGAADPGRIASGVVTGIGFIGAGAIVQSVGSVRGMTTAASIWVTAAIGIAVGSGAYVGAITATVITVLSLHFLREVVEKRIFKTKKENER